MSQINWYQRICYQLNTDVKTYFGDYDAEMFVVTWEIHVRLSVKDRVKKGSEIPGGPDGNRDFSRSSGVAGFTCDVSSLR